MANNGGRGGDGGGHGLVFWVVIILVLAAISGKTFAQDILKEGFSILKTLGIIIIGGGLLIGFVAILYAWWSSKQEQKNKEEQMKLDILNTPLETFGEKETQNLMDKYDGKEPSEQTDREDGRKTGSVNPYSAVKNPYAEEERRQTGV